MDVVCGLGVEVCIYVCVCYGYALSQDSRLCRLGNALRAAHMYRFTNGLAKAVIWRMVDLIVDEGLCDKHQMRTHV